MKLAIQTAATAAMVAKRVAAQTFTLAASGDFLGELVASNDSRVNAVWDIVRNANFGFFNMEGTLVDMTTFAGYPASENGKSNTYGDVGNGAYYDPAQASLLAAAGFSLASHANNHAFDFAEVGMYATEQALSAANITYAGSGSSLQAARRAAVRQAGDVRLGLVCAAGTHTLESAAGAGDHEYKPRPGVSALRTGVVTVVNSTVFEAIKTVALAQGQELAADPTEIVLYTGQYPYAWSTWRLADDSSSGLAWDIDDDDYTGILAAIRAASNASDSVVFSLHAHESYAGFADSYSPLKIEATAPAAYTQNISHAAIDAGAAVVLVHGPHHLRGIEIYDGRPIFYGLGSLTYSLGLDYGGYSLPIEWDDGVVAVTQFEDGVLDSIQLYPLIHAQLTNDTSDPQSALPKMAPATQAMRILNYLQKVSEPWNTTITIDNYVGYVDL